MPELETRMGYDLNGKWVKGTWSKSNHYGVLVWYNNLKKYGFLSAIDSDTLERCGTFTYIFFCKDQNAFQKGDYVKYEPGSPLDNGSQPRAINVVKRTVEQIEFDE